MKTHFLVYTHGPTLLFYICLLIWTGLFIYGAWQWVPNRAIKWIFIGIIAITHGGILWYGWYCNGHKTLLAIIEENGLSVNGGNTLLPYDKIKEVDIRYAANGKFLSTRCIEITMQTPIEAQTHFSLPVNKIVANEIQFVLHHLQLATSPSERNNWLTSYTPNHLEKMSFHLTEE